MRVWAPLSVALALAGCGTSPDQAPTPSVQVTTVAPRQGTVTRWITAYGSATPASNGVQSLSVNQPGQVTRVLVTPGAAVRAGQPLVEFALAPTALAGFEAAGTALATAREQRATTARLLSQQLATRDQLAQADKAVADAAAALAAARRDGAGAATQILRAPSDGVVTALPVAPGDRTQPGAALATVVRRGGVVVTVGLDPGDRAVVRSGQPAQLHPLDGGAAIAGRILRVDAQLNPATRLVDADLSFPAGAVMPGQALRAEVAAGTAAGWIVPHDAVVTDENGAHVFQVAAGKARAVPVRVVQPGGDRDVVAGAIQSALPLIVAGAFQVADGDPVRAGGR